MSRLLLLLALLAPQSGEWELVWSDEFDGKGIDKEKWKYDVGGHGFGNNELQFYTDRAANSYHEDGALVIHAQQEKFQNRAYTSASFKARRRGPTAASNSASSCRRGAGSGRPSG